MVNNLLFSTKQKASSVFVVAVLLLVMIPCETFASSFEKYVGQTFILPIPECPVRDGYVNSWSYSCPSMDIDIRNNGSSSPSEAVIDRYFDGVEIIECHFQYFYMVGGNERVATSSEFHSVSCLSNDISIRGNSTRLKVGETLQLSYDFEHSTFDARPEVEWDFTHGYASVDFNGRVTALRPGREIITATSNLSGNTARYEIEIEAAPQTGVSSVENDNAVEVHYYNLDGTEVKGTPTPGLYLRRQGSKVAKIVVTGNN